MIASFPRLFLFGLLSACSFAQTPDLEIFSGQQPVSFFFREMDSAAATQRTSYEEWSARYGRLNGVMGKMLDEELIGRSATQPYFRRFKQDHPHQAVLLHSNVDFRNPNSDNHEFFAGHWLYYNGARVLDAIPAGAAEVTIRVSDPSPFNLHPFNANRDIPDDVGVCALTADGKPDWSQAEQAQLIAIDREHSTIRLKRGLYHTTPRAFAAGRAYVASHVAQTWGTNNKLWQFNLATNSPRDAAGRSAAEVWGSMLSKAMSSGGELDFVDGVEFDVPFRRPMAIGGPRRADCDADGKPDDGVINGQPVFAVGVDQFFRALRAALPAKLILADTGDRTQRSTASLNGVETEGWPRLRDPNFLAWSTALNEHRFWMARARPPVFTYGLVKFRGNDEPAPFSTFRLAFAGPLMADAAVPFIETTPTGANGVWDELVAGSLQRRNWLGRAVGPARHLALDTPDLLKMVTRIDGKAEGQTFIVRIPHVPHLVAGDLVVAVTARGERLPEYPKDSYRTLTLVVVPAGAPAKASADCPTTPLDEASFAAVLYQRNVPAGPCDLVLIAEGTRPFTLEKLTVHAGADCVVREFEHGVVLANPAPTPQTFPLETLFPGKSFHRLTATTAQDAAVNNGAPARGDITLAARDALFLLKD